MTVVSDELAEKAANIICGIVDGYYDSVLKETVRAAIEAVLPDIERPWQQKVDALEKALDSLHSEWHDSCERRARETDMLETTLVERDREIERLRASVNEQLARANERTVAAEAQLAERQFSDAEREALLMTQRPATCGQVHVWMSARAKLEQGQ